MSALAYRAREGIKQAYPQAHVSDGGGPRCREAATLLGARIRGVLGYLAINVDAPEFADFAWMYAAATGLRLASRPIRSVSQVVGIASVALVVLIVALTLAHWRGGASARRRPGGGG